MNNNLKLNAKKAYEIARLKWAGVFGLLILPLVLISCITCGDEKVPITVGSLLLLSVIFMKWKGLEFGRSVNYGLISGLLVFSIPLIMHLFEICCRNNLEVLFCVASGIAGGILLGRAIYRSSGNKSKLTLFSLLIASLTATLGCASLGVGAVAALLFSLVASTLLVNVTVRKA